MARKNLFEAFQKVASDAQRREAEGGVVRAPVERAPVERPPVERPAPQAASAGAASAPNRLRLVPVAAAVALAFTLGFVAGRAGTVSAAEPDAATGASGASAPVTGVPRDARTEEPRSTRTDGAPASGSAAPTPSNAVAPTVAADTPGALFERALRDPANRYTIQVISYANNDAQRKLAGELVDHFRAAGLATSDPRPTGRYLVVLVGAAPTEADLRADLERVRALRDPRGSSGQFADALVLPIAHFVER